MVFLPPSKNIILTGIPRSGTTLTCHLLNKLTDCVALHEPINPLTLVDYKQSELSLVVLNYFNEQRQQILTTGTAASKSMAGQVPDNPLAGVDPITGKRVRKLDGRSITLQKRLPPEFYLVIKQPAFFTAILADLLAFKQFSCFAVIRNPLSVLLSWNTVEMPVANGRAPAAEVFSTTLSHTLNALLDKYERQVALLDWFYTQYATYLPEQNILDYETTIQTGGQALAAILPSAQTLNEQLSSKNNNNLYDPVLKQVLLDKLLEKKEGAYWQFYSEEAVIAVAEATI